MTASTLPVDQSSVWTPAPGRWGRGDVIAILVWIGGLIAFFWDAVALRKALFFFDITEINYPYRDFLANELKAGRFSRWFPGLYHGLPLFAESQAGYLHPLKYLLYPWLATWQALNLDTVGSIALTGLAMYGWMPAACGASGRIDGGIGFWAERVCLGASDPHEHEQRLDQRASGLLGVRSELGWRAVAWDRSGVAGVGLPGVRRAPARYDPDLGSPRSGHRLPDGDRRNMAKSGDDRRACFGLCGHGCGGRGDPVGAIKRLARPIAPRRRSDLGADYLWVMVARIIAHPGRPRGLRHACA